MLVYTSMAKLAGRRKGWYSGRPTATPTASAMTSGEILVLILFIGGLACSLTLLIGLVRLIRRERKKR